MPKFSNTHTQTHTHTHICKCKWISINTICMEVSVVVEYFCRGTLYMF